MDSTRMDIEAREAGDGERVGDDERVREDERVGLLKKLYKATTKYLRPRWIRGLYNATITYLMEELPPNADLMDLTSYCMKLCLGGSLSKGIISSLNVNMNVSKEPLMIVAEALTMGGLVFCVSCIMCWRNNTRAKHIAAKCGCCFTVAAIAIMFFRHLPNILASVVPMFVVGLVVPGILRA